MNTRLLRRRALLRVGLGATVAAAFAQPLVAQPRDPLRIGFLKRPAP